MSTRSRLKPSVMTRYFSERSPLSGKEHDRFTLFEPHSMVSKKYIMQSSSQVIYWIVSSVSGIAHVDIVSHSDIQLTSDITDIDQSNSGFIGHIFWCEWRNFVEISSFISDFAYIGWKFRFRAIGCIFGLLYFDLRVTVSDGCYTSKGNNR